MTPRPSGRVERTPTARSQGLSLDEGSDFTCGTSGGPPQTLAENHVTGLECSDTVLLLSLPPTSGTRQCQDDPGAAVAGKMRVSLKKERQLLSRCLQDQASGSGQEFLPCDSDFLPPPAHPTANLKRKFRLIVRKPRLRHTILKLSRHWPSAPTAKKLWLPRRPETRPEGLPLALRLKQGLASWCHPTGPSVEDATVEDTHRVNLIPEHLSLHRRIFVHHCPRLFLVLSGEYNKTLVRVSGPDNQGT